MPTREALEACQYEVESLSEFIERMSPDLGKTPRHLRPLIDAIEASRQREVWITVAMPPRHGKSTTLHHGLAWRTLYDPSCLNFYATFADSLAQVGSRAVRRLARNAGVPMGEAENVHHWETLLGGGLKATSVGGEVQGRGCNSGLIVCDDIIKGREQAESKLHRDRAWDWFRDDIMKRWEPGASVIVNMTRWHEDDVIGRLQRDPLGRKWRHIELPAVCGPNGEAADERTDDDVYALWPESGFTLDVLAAIRAQGEHGWWSMYQQKPYPRGGGMFKREWFKFVDDAPRGGRVVRGWDLAATPEKDSAFTAGVRVRFVDDRLYVEDCRAIQGTPLDVEKLIRMCAEQDGYGVDIDIPQDPGQASIAQKGYLASKLQGFTVRFSPEPKKSKELRAEPFAAQAQAGNVYIVRGNWNGAYLDELESFPTGRYKDRVDATSRAYAALIRKGSAPIEWAGPQILTPRW